MATADKDMMAWMTSYVEASYTDAEDDEKICRVAPATHGMGVFATRDIKKGERITLYPAHFIVWEVKGEGVTFAPKKNPEEENTYYRLTAYDNKCSISGNQRIHHSHVAGHLLNDGGVVGAFSKETLGADICRYMLTTLQNENCDFMEGENKFMWVVANRNIKMGEELCVSYNMAYWLGHFGISIKTDKQMWEFIISVCGKTKAMFLMKKHLESHNKLHLI